jgi:hypothetical protein
VLLSHLHRNPLCSKEPQACHKASARCMVVHQCLYLGIHLFTFTGLTSVDIICLTQKLSSAQALTSC